MPVSHAFSAHTFNPQALTTNHYPLTTKHGFTLIELLVVTVVIVALMGVIFRLTGIAGGTSAQETTVFRMQCLENCLSGYYATFGSYPPVPLQNASRNIFRKASSSGIQSDCPTATKPSARLSGTSALSASFRCLKTTMSSWNGSSATRWTG